MRKLNNIRTKKEFELAYEKHIEKIFRFIALRINDRERAKEMSQETFTRAWKYLTEGNTIEYPQAFFYTTANNLLKNEYRSKKEIISLETALAEKPDFEKNLAFDCPAENQSEIKEVVNKISVLPPVYKEIMYFRYIEGLAIHEIAERLSISAATASVRLHRGLNKMRYLYEHDVFTIRGSNI